MMYMDVDAALAEVPVNLVPLVSDSDFKTIQTSVAYNAAGMALNWHFVTTAGGYSVTAVTPTTGGTYDWSHQGQGMYSIEIPASGGASINNDTEGCGYFTGVATGVLPWRGPDIVFRAGGLNDLLIDSPYSTARGLAGTALPAVASGSAGAVITAGTGTAQLSVSSGSVTVGTNSDKTGYSLSQTFPTNFSALSITAAGKVTVGTNDDKTGYSLSQSFPSNFASLVISAGGIVSADAVALSGDAAAADNAESFFDGTGYAGTNNVIPLVTTTTTATNLTNAPTAGDFTATMKTSIGTAVAASAVASVTGAVGSVTGDVGGKILGGGSGAITGAGVTALLSNGTGAGQVSYLGNGVLNVNTERVNGTVQTAANIPGLLGTLAGAAATGDPDTAKTVLQYLKQIVNILAGSDGIATFPSAAAPGNAVSLAEVIREIYSKTNLIPASPAAVGSEMALVDDAITSSKFDESTAFPLKSADAGATEVARTGADGDTLETLSDQIDGVSGGGTDWTSDEKTVIKAVLGIPTSGTTPDDPTTGILDTIRDAVGVVVGVVDTIVADTNELQTDWANGGRLDVILDARASQTSVDDVPTNAELATALDAIPTAAENATQVRTELTTELGHIDADISSRLASASYTAPDNASIASILADTGMDGVVLSAATLNAIADALLKRSVSNVESTAGEHTLATIVLAMLESERSGTTWTIKRTDGSTTHATKPLTVDPDADPITGVN